MCIASAVKCHCSICDIPLVRCMTRITDRDLLMQIHGRVAHYDEEPGWQEREQRVLPPSRSVRVDLSSSLELISHLILCSLDGPKCKAELV